jgi:transglutaminase-like putative cysteine protease
MYQYLENSTYIDWKNPEVLSLALKLARENPKVIDVARACFEYVRDEIKHSWDYQLDPVTCKASDVLKYKTGFCYAKSHLLAALLRANGIHAGLCYQRLTIANDAPPFCLHGLNAVLLPDVGWYRIDARGNKPGINAGFDPPYEHLAFPIVVAGEADLPEIWPSPLPCVIDVLENSKSYKDVADNLPDMQLYEAPRMDLHRP